MRINARNQLLGTIRTVTEGAVTAESARGLGLVPGRRVVVVIKSTEVMLAVDD